MIIDIIGCPACTPAVRGPDVDARINDRHVGVRFGDRGIPTGSVLADGEWRRYGIEAFDGGEGGWIIEYHVDDDQRVPHPCCTCRREPCQVLRCASVVVKPEALVGNGCVPGARIAS